MIITVDGPSGTGKSTVARKVAEKLHYTYFDTGAMYRAVTLGLLNENIPLSDLRQIEDYLEKFSFDIRVQDSTIHYFIGDTDVTNTIRTQQVTDVVSEVAAMPLVRQTLWKIQQAYGVRKSSVFEGRDLGTVVFPEAEVKIFLDASPEIRAKRRLAEMQEKHPKEAAAFDEKTMEEELKRRDEYDSTRKLAPLRCPEDAHKIDTSNLTIDEVVEEIIALHAKKVKKLIPPWLRAKKMGAFYRFMLIVAWLPLKVFYRHKVYGLQHYIKRAAIIAPNHTSFLDPPLTAISWPQEVHFLARESLFKPFLFGSLIRSLNSHPVSGDAGDVSVFRMILQVLKEGKQIILFPEGARTDGELGEIKGGIGMLLMRSKAAIIPTYIHGTREIWGRDRKFPKIFGKTACVFGTPILWESFSHLDKKEGQAQIAQTLSKSITDLKNWYDAGAEGTPP